MSRQLLAHDIHVNGLRAILYCYGLSASRYVEYAVTLSFLSPYFRKGGTILELGCGHSILPLLWQKLRVETITLDNNQGALEWQMRKSKGTTDNHAHAILADMRYLPFKDESISMASCISTIEHIPNDGDIEAISEIGRILKNNGICVISFPLSLHEKSYFKHHWATGIPPLFQNLFKFYLPTILYKLNVDRVNSYFERSFSYEDMRDRIIRPSKSSKEDYLTLKSGHIIKLLYEKIIPLGAITLFEYLIAKFLVTSKQIKNADAIILKLRKCELK